MINKSIKQLSVSIYEAQTKLQALTLKQKSKLEKSWDVEHAYYSSSLEGSKLDRADFDLLAEAVQ